MRAASVAALVGASALFSCGPTRSTEPRPPPARAVMPSELFPEDLDLVVRVDAARVRQNPMLVGVVRDLAKSSTAGILASAKNALENAAAVWIGTRWMSDGFHGDGIVAVESPPGSDARSPSPASRPEFEIFERPATARSDPALEVILQSRGVVLATAAEADAVLRVLRAGPDPGRLDPPARGLVAFAGRVRAGAPLRMAPSSLRALTDGLIGYAGSLEERDAVEVEASLTYASADRARTAGQAADRAAKHFASLGGAAGTMGDSVKLTEVGATLQLRVSVPFAWLRELH
jgi:hypothetical protein